MKKTAKGWFDFAERPKMTVAPVEVDSIDLLFRAGVWFTMEIADEPWDDDCLEVDALEMESMDKMVRDLPKGKWFRISRMEVCRLCDSISCAHADEMNFINWDNNGLFGRWIQK